MIGFGGGPEKCRWLIDEIGFDGAVDYKDPNVARNLASACPDGVDFFSDAIGGAVAQATIPLMKAGARWYDYGNLSTYDSMVPGQTIARDDELTPELKKGARTMTSGRCSFWSSTTIVSAAAPKRNWRVISKMAG